MTYGPVDGRMQELTYDCRNRLVEAGGITYTYDAENTRTATTEDGLTTEYVTDTGGSLSRMITAYEADNTRTLYYYGAEGLAAQYNTGTGKYYAYHYDNIGSTTLITDRSGQAVERFSYGTYGELLKDAITKIRFLYNGSYGVVTGRNGLYYMRARYYNPDIKRFINQDIKVGDIGSSQSLNRYAYCEGNPVSLIDPFGLSPEGPNKGNSILDMFGIHDLLAIIGVAGNAFGFPGAVVSICSDVANAILYFKEGDPLMGAFSLLCAVLAIGDVIGAVRTGTELAKTAKLVGNAALMAQKAYVTVESASTALDLAGDAKIEYAVNGGKMTASIIAKEFGAIALAGIAAASGKSLIKDASSLARLADIRFKTTRLERSDAASGKKIQYGGVRGCFVAGTLVKTADGEKNIEEVQEGDYVLAENPETGEQGYRKVARTFIHEKYTIIHVFIGSEEIETTEEHPFYVEGVGFVPAGELNAEDIIRTADGRNLPITKVEREELEEPVLVYNFEVEEFHTYYVSGLGVLVHNTCMVEGGSKTTINDGLGGLDWTNTNGKGQTALDHVQKHAKPNYQREMHGVFRGDVQTIIEDAWANRANAKIVSDGMGGTIYNIPYQNVGYNTGYINFGQQMNYVTIVVQEGTSTVWTAFPSFGDYGMEISY